MVVVELGTSGVCRIGNGRTQSSASTLPTACHALTHSPPITHSLTPTHSPQSPTHSPPVTHSLTPNHPLTQVGPGDLIRVYQKPMRIDRFEVALPQVHCSSMGKCLGHDHPRCCGDRTCTRSRCRSRTLVPPQPASGGMRESRACAMAMHMRRASHLRAVCQGQDVGHLNASQRARGRRRGIAQVRCLRTCPSTVAIAYKPSSHSLPMPFSPRSTNL